MIIDILNLEMVGVHDSDSKCGGCDSTHRALAGFSEAAKSDQEPLRIECGVLVQNPNKSWTLYNLDADESGDGSATGVISLGSLRNGLSPREIDILYLLMEGASNKVIANTLGNTEATVKVHMKSLLRKLNVDNRTKAAIWALKNGLEATKPIQLVRVA